MHECSKQRVYFNMTLFLLLQQREYFVGAQYLKQLTPMRPPCTLYTAFCYEKIRAITRSTRIYISALERTKFVFLSCILMHQRGMIKRTSLFLSFTHAISTQQRSGNPSQQFYSLKIDNYDTQDFANTCNVIELKLLIIELETLVFLI